MRRESSFYGRTLELKDLGRFLKKKTASLLVVRGRRRIGKSRLIEEFAKNYVPKYCKESSFYFFSGIPPGPKTTAQTQKDEFARQLSEQTGLPEISANSWGKLFSLLYEKTQKGRIIILFDEISWMGDLDPDFPANIKNAWDQKFKQNPELILFLCGSASAWIEENILSSTGFVGRISYTLTLEELPLSDCTVFWGKKSPLICAYEKFKILSITGGIPKYLEEIDPALSAEENIRTLCFTKGGFLVEEFDHLFSNIFQRKTPLYKKIVHELALGAKEPAQLAKDLSVGLTGRFSEYLRELELSGIIKRDYTWNISSNTDSKLSKYRLSDNYIRFYLKYIDPQKSKIERNTFRFKSLLSLEAWSGIMGLAFENIVLNNRGLLHQKLGIHPDEIITENPFYQRATTKHPGCQIDYMIETRFQTLYICEIKFSKNPIPKKIMTEVREKIQRLYRPKGFSCRPVLIHVNGVEKEVEESGFFSDIIDFGNKWVNEWNGRGERI